MRLERRGRGRVLRWASSVVGVIILAAWVGAHRPRAPDGPAPRWPHEPAEYREISDQPWDAVPSRGWTPIWGPSRVIVDSTAPWSPPNLLEIRYPIGFAGGAAPGTVVTRLHGTRKIFVGMWWKPSAAWQGHNSNVNKLQFLFPHDGDGDLTMVMYGPPGGPYELRVLPQFRGLPSEWLLPNQADHPVTLGEWHRVEWVVEWSSSPGDADGVIRWWLDGELLGSYDDLPFPDGGFIEYKLSPTWGGVGDVKQEEDTFLFDHLRLSGR